MVVHSCCELHGVDVRGESGVWGNPPVRASRMQWGIGSSALKDLVCTMTPEPADTPRYASTAADFPTTDE